MILPTECLNALQKAGLDIRVDPVSRALFSTDASIYQIEPLGVAFPRRADELSAAVEIASQHNVPILARGAGSSTAGQAIGPALILDCSRHLHGILDLNLEAQTITVEPGLVINNLNRFLAKHGFTFGPDPASSERATIGGSIANNATGAHSLIYGMAGDHLVSAEVILADGTKTRLQSIPLEEAQRIASRKDGLESRLYAAALQVRETCAEAIQQNYPRTWRRAAGYNLNYLLPWSPSSPAEWAQANCLPGGSLLPYPPIQPGEINLAPLLAASEGTLAVIQKATLRVSPKPKHTLLALLTYPSLVSACEAVPELLEHHPSAIELIPWELVELARSLPAYAAQCTFINEAVRGKAEVHTLQAVEFAGDDPDVLFQRGAQLPGNPTLAPRLQDQQQVWAVRKVGLGIVMSRPGDLKPAAFIEDISVPVENFAQFCRETERIMAAHGSKAEVYGHASVGCLHIRPLVNLKEGQGVQTMRSIAEEVITLAIGLGASVSGEHSVGLARGEWLAQAYGNEILSAYRQLKQAADPNNLLNPGKVLDVQPMDTNLRYGEKYRSQAWQPVLEYQHPGQAPGAKGLAEAIEQCNGAGVCRKSEGVMCPSFQATQEEMHSTRGRSNLLRWFISGQFPSRALGEEAVREALDLCLACKGCKSECPSGVDVARLRYEFFHAYYQTHRRKLRDYLFGYIGIVAKLGAPFGGLANWIMANPLVRKVAQQWFGLEQQRPFPRFAHQSMSRQVKRNASARPPARNLEKVLVLSDSFTEYFYPEAGVATIRALRAAGCDPVVLPVLGAGRTLISKSFLEAARVHASRLVTAIRQADPNGCLPVVGIEPSEILTVRDEFPAFFPADPYVQALAGRSWMIDEFLVRPGSSGKARLQTLKPQAPAWRGSVLLHGHCYQKAQPPAADGLPSGVGATLAMLRQAGYEAKLIESGCCGMAGAFGYETEHFDLSMKVGEMSVFPAVRDASPQAIIAASGVSCQAQIEDGTGRKTVHPITLL